MNYISDPSLSFYLPLHEVDGSFLMSRDACGHPGTANNYSWRFRGRYFDGSDDVISFGDITSLRFGTTNFSIMGWELWDGSEGDLLKKYSPYKGYYVVSYTNGNIVLFLRSSSSVYAYRNTNLPARSAGQWLCFGFTVDRPANIITCYANGVISQGNYTVAGGFGPGSDISTTQDLYLGKPTATGEPYYGGTIGEILVFNRKTTPGEHQRYYLATRWRYQ